MLAIKHKLNKVEEEVIKMYYTLKIEIKIDGNEVVPDEILEEAFADKLQDARLFQLTSFDVLEVND